jgi:hypothetical protein
MTLQLRKASSEDIISLGEWLSQDQDHKGQSVDNWIGDTGELITFYDEEGSLYTVKRELVARIHFQHNPAASKLRLAKAMTQGIKWLKYDSRKQGFASLIFESTVKSLIGFFKRYGFVASPNEYKAGI